MLHLYRQHGICLYLSPGIRSRENILSLVEKLFSGFKKLFSCLENILSSFENKFSRHENNFFCRKRMFYDWKKKDFSGLGKVLISCYALNFAACPKTVGLICFPSQTC